MRDSNNPRQKPTRVWIWQRYMVASGWIALLLTLSGSLFHLPWIVPVLGVLPLTIFSGVSLITARVFAGCLKCLLGFGGVAVCVAFIVLALVLDANTTVSGVGEYFLYGGSTAMVICILLGLLMYYLT